MVLRIKFAPAALVSLPQLHASMMACLQASFERELSLRDIEIQRLHTQLGLDTESPFGPGPIAGILRQRDDDEMSVSSNFSTMTSRFDDMPQSSRAAQPRPSFNPNAQRVVLNRAESAPIQSDDGGAGASAWDQLDTAAANEAAKEAALEAACTTPREQRWVKGDRLIYKRTGETVKASPGHEITSASHARVLTLSLIGD